MVAFFITFMEAYGHESMVNHFTYVFATRAFKKHAGFWYAIGRGDVAGFGGLPSNMG